MSLRVQFWLSERRFGPYKIRQITEGAYTLLRGRTGLQLEPQPLKLLWLLTSSPGRVFTKDELAEELSVTEDRIRRIVDAVRQALEDTADPRRYIKTIPTVGYQFVAKIKRPYNRAAIAAIGTTVIAAAAFLIFGSRHDLDEQVMNDKALNLTGIAVSPDGKKLAFVGESGLYLRETAPEAPTIRTRLVGIGSVASVAWSWNGQTLLLTGSDQSTGRPALWRYIPGSARPTKFMDDVAEAAESLEGHLAWINADRTAITTCPTTEECRQVFAIGAGSVLSGISWLNGDTVVIGSFSTSDPQLHLTLTSLNEHGTAQQEILRDESITGFCASSEGRLLYATAEAKSQGQYNSKFWEQRVGSALRKLLFQWTDSIVSAVGCAKGGATSAILRGRYTADAYVADINPSGGIGEARPFAASDSNEFPTAWTADSQRLIYHTDRLGSFGNFGLFSQALDETEGHPLVTSSVQDIRGARLSPDGKSIIYYTRRLPTPWRKTWMRIQTDGTGVPQRLPLEPADYDMRCPTISDAACVLREKSKDKVSFFLLDLQSGAKQPITKFPIRDFGRDIHWSVTSSGKRLAILRNGSAQCSIVVLRLDQGFREELTRRNVGNLESLDWHPDETGWYASRSSGYGMDVMFIGRDRGEQLLRRQIRNFVSWAVPSPDGRHIAMLEWTANSKAYLLQRAR